MNKTARLFLILFLGVGVLIVSILIPEHLFLWLLISLLLLLIGMLLLYPERNTVHHLPDNFEKEHARLEASINSLQMGYLLIDADHNLLTINSRAQALLHAVPPLPAEHFYNNLPIISKNFTMQKLEDIFAETFDLKGAIDECILKRKPIEKKDVAFGKKYFHFMLSPIVIFKKRPEAIGCVILLEDATEARLQEKSRDDFFSIASHELRTPLTAIRGNVSLIQEYFASTVSNERFSRMLSDIHESSLRLIHIVDDFLDTSRLEQGRLTFKKEAINVSEILEYLTKEYEPVAQQKKLTVTFHKPKQEVVVLGDVDRIKQVLINIIANGIKHTEKGGVELSVESKGTSVHIRIKDTGAGISTEVQQKLFTKFQRAERGSYTKDEKSGTGLGLYITRLLMEGMNGKVQLEKTEIGKGSTFMLTLPLSV